MPPKIPYYSSDITREQAIEIVVGLHRDAGTLTSRFSTNSYRIEVTILVITVLTSGGIWVLISEAMPKEAAWLGAIFSTITSGLIIYQLTLGPKKRVKPVYELYEKIGKELANLRGGRKFNPSLFWDNYKRFEYDLQRLQNPVDPN